MVYRWNDDMQQFIPFVFHANANAALAGMDRKDFLTVRHIVLAKVENTSTIKCNDVAAFAQVSTKRNQRHPRSLHSSSLSLVAASISFSFATKCAQQFRMKAMLRDGCRKDERIIWSQMTATRWSCHL